MDERATVEAVPYKRRGPPQSASHTDHRANRLLHDTNVVMARVPSPFRSHLRRNIRVNSVQNRVFDPYQPVKDGVPDRWHGIRKYLGRRVLWIAFVNVMSRPNRLRSSLFLPGLLAMAMLSGGTGCSSQLDAEHTMDFGTGTGTGTGDSGPATGGGEGTDDGTETGYDPEGTDTDSDTDDGGTGGEPDLPPALDVGIGESACGDESVEVEIPVPDSEGQSSPAHARAVVLNEGGTLMDVSVRPWEFLNYYSFDYPEAVPGELALVPELVVDPANANKLHLQINVSSEQRSNAERPPLHVALVLDTSESMAGTPLLLMQESCRAIAKNLRAGDTVSIVQWSTGLPLLAGHLVDQANDPVVLDVIDGLVADGSSDLVGGLSQAYELLGQSNGVEANHLVLFSDGQTAPDETAAVLVEQQAGSVQLMGVGVGEASSFDDRALRDVCDTGAGASMFVGDADEAWRVFDANFVNTFDTAAEDVRITVELPPSLRLNGSSDAAEIDESSEAGQSLAPNDTLVVRRELTTCSSGQLPVSAEIRVRVDYRDPISQVEKSTEVTAEVAALIEQASDQTAKATAVLAYAQTLQLWSDPWQWTIEQREYARHQALDQVGAALEVLPEDPELSNAMDVLHALVK